MKPKSLMLIAGEASGDMLAAELVPALNGALADVEVDGTWDLQPLHTSLAPHFFGAGGPRMKAAGVDLAFDMTRHSVIGLSDVLKNYLKFRRLFRELYNVALERTPDAIVCVDFSGFNRRFGHAIRQHVRARQGWFHSWNPVLIQYVSPQVWASREGRARQVARDFDLLLSIIPFEKQWYARHAANLRVEFVGHPMVDRFGNVQTGIRSAGEPPLLLLLPGSRPDELRRHLPAMLDATARIRAGVPGIRMRMILPTETLREQARALPLPADLEAQVGGLHESLAHADVAIASTGTVTLECAYFGVPTVALYKTSWTTYQIGRRIVNVKYLAMPNLLANEEIFPEFIQHAATPENVANAALDLLRNEQRRTVMKRRLAEVAGMLGGPGASRRAARAIVELLTPHATHMKTKR
jgi:lipid-A-disaccharide synthase